MSLEQSLLVPTCIYGGPQNAQQYYCIMVLALVQITCALEQTGHGSQKWKTPQFKLEFKVAELQFEHVFPSKLSHSEFWQSFRALGSEYRTAVTKLGTESSGVPLGQACMISSPKNFCFTYRAKI
jgi:hypothetical protein